MRLFPVILAGGCAVRAGERRICFTLGFFGVLLCVMDWVYSDYDKKLAEDLGSYLGTSPILGALVLQRGYSDPIKARMFLNPKLADLDKEIEDAQSKFDTVSPFIGGAKIQQIMAVQEKMAQKEHLDQLLAKRREIEVNLSLIQDYIKKATR